MPPCPAPGTAYLNPCNTSYSCTVGIGDLSSCCVQFPFGQGTVNCGEDFRQSAPLREPRPLRLRGCGVMWCSLRRSPVPVFTTGESSGVTFTNNLSFSQNYAVVMLATHIRDTRGCSQRTCLKSHAHVIGRPLTPVPRPCGAFCVCAIRRAWCYREEQFATRWTRHVRVPWKCRPCARAVALPLPLKTYKTTCSAGKLQVQIAFACDATATGSGRIT